MKTQWKPLFAGLVALATLLTGCSSGPAQTTGSQTPAVSASGGQVRRGRQLGVTPTHVLEAERAS